MGWTTQTAPACRPWARSLVLCQTPSRAPKARVRLAWPGHSQPRRAEHPQPSCDGGSLNPKPLQRIACKPEPDMLRISKGIVSIFHTGPVIYNSLRVLTSRLGSSDNPPKMRPQGRGQRAGRGERRRAAQLPRKSRYSCTCLVGVGGGGLPPIFRVTERKTGWEALERLQAHSVKPHHFGDDVVDSCGFRQPMGHVAFLR